MSALDQILALKSRMSESIIGQDIVVERILIGLLANGNLLVEGLPGLAKTRAVKALAKNLEADFNRIQFTPDLLPSDVTGNEVYYSNDGHSEFRFEPGPIFGNLILGDEINRAPAKVQSAMLEAMEERQVTVAGKTHKLPAMFMVMATQNPIEQEGTYPLPEAQMDRFLMHVVIQYTSAEDEITIVNLVRNEEQEANQADKEARLPTRMPQQIVFDARAEIADIHISDAMRKYQVDLVYATRNPENYSDELRRWISVGASPRASLSLDKCSRCHAWLKHRDFVDPQDVRAIAHDVLRHRIMLSYEAQGEGITSDQVIDEIIKQVALP